MLSKGENMKVGELIAILETVEPDCNIVLDACLNTPAGQVFFAEELDTVCRPVEYGRNARAVVLCNWNGPVVHLCDLNPID